MSAEDRGCLVCSACRQKAPQQLHVQLTASQRCRALCFLDRRQHQHPLDGHPCWVVFNQRRRGVVARNFAVICGRKFGAGLETY